MSGGKRVKFQDTRIQFLTGWSADSPRTRRRDGRATLKGLRRAPDPIKSLASCRPAQIEVFAFIARAAHAARKSGPR